MRAADAAQYTAKRTGRRRVYIAQPQIPHAPGTPDAAQPRRAMRDRDRDGVDLNRMLEDTLAQLDSPVLRNRRPLQRLSAVASCVGAALDSSAWTISFAERGAGTLRTMLVVEGRDQAGIHFDTEGESYDLETFPETVRILEAGGAFVVAAEDEEADEAERRLLEKWGLCAVLAAAAPGPAGAWLIEVYADEDTRDLHTAAPYVRLLVAEALREVAQEPPLAHRALRLA